MALDFPTSPTLNEIYSYEGRSWKWNGYAWDVFSSGATFSNNVQIIGDLNVTGKIITETGVFGATYNAAIEVMDNLSMDGGEF